MQRTGRNFGMNIPPPSAIRTLQFSTWDVSELQSFLTSMKDKGVGLFVIVIPDIRDSYGKRSDVLMKYPSIFTYVSSVINFRCLCLFKRFTLCGEASRN
jgi:hypothetical protein